MSSKLTILVFLGVALLLDSARGELFGNGDYNSTCRVGVIDWDCDTSRGFLCNQDTGRCGCYDKWGLPMDYDENTGRCDPYVGGICYIMGSDLRYHELVCKDPNASCFISCCDDEDRPYSTCKCNDGYEPSWPGYGRDSKCVLQSNQTDV